LDLLRVYGDGFDTVVFGHAKQRREGGIMEEEGKLLNPLLTSLKSRISNVQNMKWKSRISREIDLHADGIYLLAVTQR
jgi:hypothetical protein